MTTIETIRLTTEYAIVIDAKTLDKLAQMPNDAIAVQFAVRFIGFTDPKTRVFTMGYLCYTVEWSKDNEYVHKAMRKWLRQRIKL